MLAGRFPVLDIAKVVGAGGWKALICWLLMNFKCGKRIKIKNLLLKVLVLHKFFWHGKFNCNCWET